MAHNVLKQELFDGDDPKEVLAKIIEFLSKAEDIFIQDIVIYQNTEFNTWDATLYYYQTIP